MRFFIFKKFLLKKIILIWKILESHVIWCTEEGGKLNFKLALEISVPSQGQISIPNRSV